MKVAGDMQSGKFIAWTIALRKSTFSPFTDTLLMCSMMVVHDKAALYQRRDQAALLLQDAYAMHSNIEAGSVVITELQLCPMQVIFASKQRALLHL